MISKLLLIKLFVSELIAIGPELTRYYFDRLFEYRKQHPGTKVGAPGRTQVCNNYLLLLGRFKGGNVVLFKKYFTEGSRDLD